MVNQLALFFLRSCDLPAGVVLRVLHQIAGKTFTQETLVNYTQS